MAEDTVHINLCGAQVTPIVLAQIANALEAGHPVLVTNAAVPAHGAGIGAFMLGRAQALLDMEELSERIEAIEDHPALSIPALGTLRG